MKTKTEQQEAIERIKKLPYKEQKKYTHVSDYYILMAFFEIIKFTDRIFLTDKIKGEIFRKTELDFFEREHKDEAGKITEGIKTFWQLEQFVNHYNQQLEIFQEKMLVQKVNEYNQLDIKLKKEVLSKDLYSYKKFNLITGGNALTKKIEKLAKIEKKYLTDIKEFNKTKPTGFICKLAPETTIKVIFNLMVEQKHISGNLSDFQAIFSNTPKMVGNPVKWLLKHNENPNKTALFTFLKLMLQPDKFPRKFLRQANNLFLFGNENIFPNKYTYPDETSQITAIGKHFKSIETIIKDNNEKTRPE